MSENFSPTAGLSPDELNRYARHLILPGFGEEGQLALRRAAVLVVGAGGLGAPLLAYLAAAGIGRIGIVDPDRVSVSNLQRQVLFGQEDLGQLKVEAARSRIRALNPHVQVDIYPEALTRRNAADIIASYDIVADGTDNFPTRYLVNDACVLYDKVNVHGAIFRFEGQVAVFNLPLPEGGRSPNYRDLFPQPPAPGATLSCAEGGVLGVLPGIIGSMQAAEVIKVAAGLGEPLAGKIFLFDAARFESRTVGYRSRPGSRVSALVDYELFCGLPAREEATPVISAQNLQILLAQDPHIQLLDVREPHEHAQWRLSDTLIPLAALPARLHELNPLHTVVVYCQSGARSARAARILADAGFTQVFRLEQ